MTEQLETTLTNQELSISYVSNSLSNNSYITNSLYTTKTPVGYIEMFDGYSIPVYTKPSNYHLDSMEQYFGWKYKPANTN